MKRRNVEGTIGKLRRAAKRGKLSDGSSIYNFIINYKFLLVWLLVILLDFVADFRFELFYPLWSFLFNEALRERGISYLFANVFLTVTLDMICYFLLPMHWLLFASTTYVWLEFAYLERGLCSTTVWIWIVMILAETLLRRELKTLHFEKELVKPLAAHGVGFPIFGLGIYCKSYIHNRFRCHRKQLVAKENELLYMLLQPALEPPADMEIAEASLAAVREITLGPYHLATISSGRLDEPSESGSLVPLNNGHLTPSSQSSTAFSIYSTAQAVETFLSSSSSTSSSSLTSSFSSSSINFSSSKIPPISSAQHKVPPSSSAILADRSHNRLKLIFNDFLTSSSNPPTAIISRASIQVTCKRLYASFLSLLTFLTPKVLFSNTSTKSRKNAKARKSSIASPVDKSSEHNQQQQVNGQVASKSPCKVQSNQNGCLAKTGDEMNRKSSQGNIAKQHDVQRQQNGSVSCLHNGITSNGLKHRHSICAELKTNDELCPVMSEIHLSTPPRVHETCDVNRTESTAAELSNSTSLGSTLPNSKTHSKHSSSSGKKSKQTRSADDPAHLNDVIKAKEDHIWKLESDIQRFKLELQTRKQCESDLQDQINILKNEEKILRSTIASNQTDIENLQKKVQSYSNTRQQDRHLIQKLEKQLDEEKRKSRASIEMQAVSEKKARIAEESAAKATALAEAARSVCSDSCRSRQREVEHEVARLRKEIFSKDELLRRKEVFIEEFKEMKNKEAMFMSTMAAMHEKNSQIEEAYNIEKMSRMEFQAALEMAKRQFTKQRMNCMVHEREIRELKRKFSFGSGPPLTQSISSNAACLGLNGFSASSSPSGGNDYDLVNRCFSSCSPNPGHSPTSLSSGTPPGQMDSGGSLGPVSPLPQGSGGTDNGGFMLSSMRDYSIDPCLNWPAMKPPMSSGGGSLVPSATPSSTTDLQVGSNFLPQSNCSGLKSTNPHSPTTVNGGNTAMTAQAHSSTPDFDLHTLSASSSLGFNRLDHFEL